MKCFQVHAHASRYVTWEQFHTLDDIPVFSQPTAATPGKACR